jgi:hypothetical protein
VEEIKTDVYLGILFSNFSAGRNGWANDWERCLLR